MSRASVSERQRAHEEVSVFEWAWHETRFRIGQDVSSSGTREPLLMLPAMSTVSTREELQALADALVGRCTVRVDWPGFGNVARPKLDYSPALYRQFLQDLGAHLRQQSGAGMFPVVACGHAAGYAVDLAARVPGTFSGLILIAPTWRGPLPTVMEGRRPVQGQIRRLLHAPLVGEALYRLNVSRPVVRMMYRGHVFADPAFLTDALVAERMRVARQPGARFASACFVTGALDPFDDRAAFLDAARTVRAPILVLYGRDTPPRSLAEMEALAALPGIHARRLEHGALGLAEEHAAELAPLIAGFLASMEGGPAPP